MCVDTMQVFKMDLLVSVIWTDNWRHDMWIYIRHMHPVLGLFSHEQHPLSIWDRLLILGCGWAFALANTASGKCPWWVYHLLPCVIVYEYLYKILIGICIAICMALVKQMLLCKCCLTEGYSTRKCAGIVGFFAAVIMLIGCMALVAFAFCNTAVSLL